MTAISKSATIASSKEAKAGTMKQLNLRVEDEILKAFYDFCKKQGTTPYQLLGSIVSFYGRAMILRSRMDENKISQEEALIELGHILEDVRRFARANGEFREAVTSLLKPYGITLDRLWPT